MHFDLDRRLDAGRSSPSSPRRCAAVLGDVRRDGARLPGDGRPRRGGWSSSRAPGAARYADDEVDETVAFLEWLLHDNFIFLGYREYRIARRRDRASCPAPGSGSSPTTARSTYARAACRSTSLPRRRARARARGRPADRLQDQPALARAPARADGLRRRAQDLARRARSSARRGCSACSPPRPTPSPPSQTPLLHRKLRQILRHEDLIEGSHDYKAAVSLFDSFPKDELFAASTDDLRRAVVALLALRGRPQVRLLGRRDPDGRARLADRRAAALALRRRAARAPARRCCRERFGTDAVDSHTRARRGRARPHPLHASTRPSGVPDARLRASSSARSSRSPARGTTSCATRLVDAPRPTRGPRAGGAAGAPRFPRYYKRLGAARAGRSPTSAASSAWRRAASRSSSGCRTSRRAAAHARRRSTRRGGKVELADAMPMLEDLGLRVIEEVPTRLQRRRRRDLGAGLRRARPGRPRRSTSTRSASASPTASRPSGAATPSPTRSTGSCSSAGLDWRQVDDPARLPHVPPADRLALHRGLPERRAGGATPTVTAKLVRYFELRFDPDARARRGGRGGAARGDPRRPRRGRVARPRPHPAQPARADRRDAAHERLPAAAASAMAFKLRSADVPAIPQPAPLFEIYVYSPGDGGHPPARRQDRARRHPLVGPPGLPHRGLRPDARADDQERRDRARRAPRAASTSSSAAGGPERAARRGRAPVRRATSRGAARR